MDCAFCRIVDGLDHPPELVAERDEWIAFFPLEPATLGHTLVVPRAHVSDFWEAPPEMASVLARACNEVGVALRSVISPEGMNLITSAGSAAEQTVFHLHLHVVPRWKGDAIGPIWPVDDSGVVSLHAVASDLREALAR